MDGSVAGRPLFFFPYADGYAALIGIDLEARPGRTPWRIGFVDGAKCPQGAPARSRSRRRKFPVQRLSLPKSMVDLSPEKRAPGGGPRRPRLPHASSTRSASSASGAAGSTKPVASEQRPRLRFPAHHQREATLPPFRTRLRGTGRHACGGLEPGRVALVVATSSSGARWWPRPRRGPLHALHAPPIGGRGRGGPGRARLDHRERGQHGRATGPHLHWAAPSPPRPPSTPTPCSRYPSRD